MKKTILALSALMLAASASAATVKIGVLAPLTGSISAIGNDVKTGAELAIEQRKAEFSRLGIEIKPVILDDKGDATTGAALAADALKDSALLGFVGPTKSGVSLKVGEVIAASSNPAALISPASTNDDLTKNGWKFYHRTTAPDGAQAAVAAEYIATVVKPKSVYIITDNQTFGNFIQTELAELLRKRGVKIAGLGAVTNGDAAGVSGQSARAIASGADLVFYTGLYDGAAPVVKALRASSYDGLFMGGNGLDNADFAKQAGPAAAGVRYITGFGPVQNYNNGAGFISTYRAKYGALPGARAAFTYDATNALLDAIAAAARQAKGTPTRAQVNTALDRVSISASRGVTGAIAFTPTGERRVAPMMIVEINPRTLQGEVISGRQHRSTK